MDVFYTWNGVRGNLREEFDDDYDRRKTVYNQSGKNNNNSSSSDKNIITWCVVIPGAKTIDAVYC